MTHDAITWRPGGTRVVAYAVAVVLVVLIVVIGLALPDDIVFHLSERITLGLILGATLLGLHGVGRSRVTADRDGVHVLNGYRAHDVAWSDIKGFSMNTGAPWPTLVTQEDDRLMLFGIQGSDGPAARAAVEELARRLAEATS